MQIKTMMKYHNALARMAKLNRLIAASANEDVEQRELSHAAGGDATWHGHHGGQSADFSPYDPTIPFLRKSKHVSTQRPGPKCVRSLFS